MERQEGGSTPPPWLYRKAVDAVDAVEKYIIEKTAGFKIFFFVKQNCLVDIFAQFGKLFGSLDSVRSS